MSWLNTLLGIETRDGENIAKPIDEMDDLDVVLQGDDYKTRVTRQQALSVPAVASCVYLISGIIAGLPIHLYKREADRVIEIKDDTRIHLLNLDTNSILGAFETKQSMINDLLLEGNTYCYIGKDGNTPINLQYLPKNSVSLIDDGKRINRQVAYLVDGYMYDDFNIMRVVKNSKDGVRGSGIIDDNYVLLSSMYNALQYENGAMSKGGKKGFLKSEGKLSDKMLDALKRGWRKLYSNNSSEVIVLNKGLSFEAADSTATENQLNENKQTNTELVYKLFGFTENTFKDDKAFNIFAKTSIMPVAKCLIEALNRYLLLESEKGYYYFSFDMNDLLKADMLTRYNAYKTALEAHWVTVDEVRNSEDYSPLGIDFVGLNLADVIYDPQTKCIYTPNTGQFGDLTKLKGGVRNNED